MRFTAVRALARDSPDGARNPGAVRRASLTNRTCPRTFEGRSGRSLASSGRNCPRLRLAAEAGVIVQLKEVEPRHDVLPVRRVFLVLLVKKLP